jgi:3-oxoacyl-[acyl-carrier protein] reductase
VSGSGRGIGRAIAVKLAAAGASVVVNDLDPLVADETVQAIVENGGKAVVCAGSVTDDAFADRFVSTAMREFGGIDIVINNAGFTWSGVIQKMTDEQWDAILDVHLRAPFRILRAVQPIISARVKQEKADGQVKSRRVVNITSIVGAGGGVGQANYASAKSGLIGLTKTLSKEWGRYNVTVNAVAFGVIRTRLTEAPGGADSTMDVQGQKIEMGVDPALLSRWEQDIPLGRAGTPEEAAGAVYILCLPEANYISGQVLICGGGYQI